MFFRVFGVFIASIGAVFIWCVIQLISHIESFALYFVILRINLKTGIIWKILINLHFNWMHENKLDFFERQKQTKNSEKLISGPKVPIKFISEKCVFKSCNSEYDFEAIGWVIFEILGRRTDRRRFWSFMKHNKSGFILARCVIIGNIPTEIHVKNFF